MWVMASAAQTVVFDLDGTLTDSQAGVVASYGHALAGWGIEVDGDAIRPWLGPPLRDGFLALGVRPAEVERAIQRYREYFSTQGILENQLYPGIVAMLATLSKTGLTVAVATSKLEEYALRILDQFSISTYFRVVVGSSADGTRVHKDEILEHALKNLGSPDPATTVMVGDRKHDVRAAIDLGVRPIGVTWGYGATTELLQAGADALADSPSELTKLLLG
jgi:phosphoglycolate phosphatase